MASIGLVGAGAMGSALGACWRAGGLEVRTVLAGRSERTRRRVVAAGIDVVDGLDGLVHSDVVVSVVPPGQARAVARDIAAAARRTGARPLVVDLNAVSPRTVRAVQDVLARAGLDLVDGSVSGPPPRAGGGDVRVYLSGGRAADVAALPAPGVDMRRLAGPAGTASALAMCTASLSTGSTALQAQAMLTARRHGVLAEFFDDTSRQWPGNVRSWPLGVAFAATQWASFADETVEIARTQRDAGLPAELFDGVAAAYTHLAGSRWGARDPGDVDAGAAVEQVLDDLGVPSPALPAAVLFDFSGTLFHIEPAAVSLLRAIGPDAVALAPEILRYGGINGAGRPDELPAELADVWAQRDLSLDAHRAAYSGLSMRAGLDRAQADRLYEHGISASAWHPFPDTIRALRTLRANRVPVAVVSNIGWDPRPVLARYGVDGDIDLLVLSYERGVEKPDPRIFTAACDELGVRPADAVMIGDNPENDGGSRAVGIPFVEVSDDPDTRATDGLVRAVPGLAALLAAPRPAA